jgi:tryptophan synthase alpha chain
MNYLTNVFGQRKRKSLLMTFTVAGDPDFGTSLEIIKALIKGGADIIELGLPFSDPVADGPVIQRADQRALAAGMNTDRFFDLCRMVRRECEIPLVVLTYTNLVFRRGIEKFYSDAAKAGINAVVIADLPYEESGPYVQAAEKSGVLPVMMVSTTTSDERLLGILKVKSGFIYLVAVLGVTGARTGINPDSVRLLKKIKGMTTIPVAPGFGISEREQVVQWESTGADAVIVGSGVVKIIEEEISNHEQMQQKLISYVRSLSGDLISR